jgi:anti-sigma regulatory factor (Ser/Thr protein kinase)
VSESIELSPEPASVAVARRWSRALAVQAGAAEVADTMVLLVSELVSNVVLHARTPCQLQVDADHQRVRVEVVDGSDVLPEAPAHADPWAQSGRGLLLVQGLSAAHGVSPVPGGGKRVWFELAVSSTSRVR